MTQRAAMLLQQSRYDLAEKELRQILAQDPNDAHAHALLALSLMEQGKLPEAESSARQAVQLMPDQPYYHYCLGSVKARKNDLPGARRAVEEALRLNPEDSDCHALRAFIYLRAGHWKKALKAANEGLTHDPTHQECLNHRAEALVELNRYKDAYQTMGRALQKDPKNERTHANLGWAYLRKGRCQPALEHFREALRLNPHDEDARRGLVEGLKARYFIYRLVWRHFSPLEGLGMMIVLCAVLGTPVLPLMLLDPSVGEHVTVAIPLLYFGILGVLPFIMAPMSNLLLQCNRHARYVLSEKERWSSTIFGLLLLSTIAAALCGAVTGRQEFYWLALNTGLLIFPATRLFDPDGRINTNCLALTIGMALLGVLALGSFTLGYRGKVELFSGLNLLGFTVIAGCVLLAGMQRPKV